MNKRGLILDNIPNLLTVSRIILTFVVMYLIFAGNDIRLIIVIFAIAALTDFFDGRLARRFKWVSEFGRKADMIADRFLWVGTALAFLISAGLNDQLHWYLGFQLLFIMSREVVSAPFALIAFFSGKDITHARYIAKVTTFIQGFALPALIVSVYYPIFMLISVPLSLVCAVTGFMSAIYYMHDIHAPRKKRKSKK